jgi:type II secretory pathway component GspD/PulD (secretin)
MKSYRTSMAILPVWVCTLMAAPSIFAADPAGVATPDAAAAAPPAFLSAPAPSTPQPFPPAAPDPMPAPSIPRAAASTPNAAASAPTAAASPVLIQAEGDEKFTLNFRNVPIEEAFELLSRKEKVNIIVSKGVSGPVSVNLYQVTLKEAIQSVANAAGFLVEMRNGDYVILTRDSNFELPGSSLQLKTLKVQYSDTTQIATLLTKYISRYGKITPLLGRKLIVVEDFPAFVERIERLLEQLDAPPKQIMIEAKILEITLNENETFGIDWKRIFNAGSGSGTIGTTGLANGNATVPGQGFFFSFLNSRVDLFFSALATAGRVRTLSTPKLLALENQEAKVIIGDSTGYSVTTTINLVSTQSIQFLESGVILKVIPSVDQRGRVLLKIQPEVSTATLQAGIPSKKSTQVTTELICDDGQSIFIAGLIKATGTTERDGVPILKDLPLLGRLFSNTTESVGKAETVVIITPYIVSQPSDLARESEEKVRQADDAAGSILEQQLRLERRRPIP